MLTVVGFGVLAIAVRALRALELAAPKLHPCLSRPIWRNSDKVFNEKEKISMGIKANYKLTVHGEDAAFSQGVEFLETPEKVLQKAAEERYSLFGQTNEYLADFQLKMLKASKKYPSLLFEVKCEFPEDGGYYTKVYFQDGKMAQYDAVMTFPPFNAADLK
jgi:hypothetical protein